MTELTPNTNSGVLVKTQDSDYIAGASPLLNRDINTIYDWTLFVRPGERQSSSTLDAMDCVTQGLCNSFETQVEFYIYSKLLSDSWIQKATALGFFALGRFRISRRFTAKISGTTPQGNFFQQVADSIRKDGVVAESKYPSDTDGFNWATYYQPLTPELIALGKESLKLFSALYEQVSSIATELNHSPMVVLTHVASGWNIQNPVLAEDGPVQHCTMVFKKSDFIYDEDSYGPQFVKHLSLNYPVPFAFKFIVSPLDPNVLPPPPFLFKRDLVYGETSEDVRQLQIRLDIEQTRKYDDNTKSAVFRYQLSNLPHTFYDVIISLSGRRLGPASRKQLNSTL